VKFCMDAEKNGRKSILKDWSDNAEGGPIGGSGTDCVGRFTQGSFFIYRPTVVLFGR
jgi:hypothetical protein